MFYGVRFVKTAGSPSASISGSGAATIYVWTFPSTNAQLPGTLTCTLDIGAGNVPLNVTEILVAHGHRTVWSCYDPAKCDANGDPLVGGSTTSGFWYKDKVTCPVQDCDLGGSVTLPAVGGTRTDTRFGGVFKRITNNVGGTATCHYYVERPYADFSKLLYLMYPCAGFGQPAKIYDNLGNIVTISGSSLRAWWSSITPGRLCRLSTVTLASDSIECGTWNFTTHTFPGFSTVYTDADPVLLACDTVNTVICMGGALKPNKLDQVVFNTSAKIKIIGLADSPVTVLAQSNLSLVPDYATPGLYWKNWQISTDTDSFGRYWIREAGSPSMNKLLSWKPGETVLTWEGGIVTPYNALSSVPYPASDPGYRWALPAPDSTLVPGHADFVNAGGESYYCSPTEVDLPDTMILNMCYKLSTRANQSIASELGGGANMQHSVGSTDYIAGAAFAPVIAVSGGTHTASDVLSARVNTAVGNGVTTTFTFTDTHPGGWGAATKISYGGSLFGGVSSILNGHGVLTGCADGTHCTMLSGFNGTIDHACSDGNQCTGVMTEDTPWVNSGVSGQEIAACRPDNGHCRHLAKWCNAPFDHSWNAPDLSSMLNPTLSINQQGTEIMGHCNFEIPEGTNDYTIPTKFPLCSTIQPNEFDCAGHGIYVGASLTSLDINIYLAAEHIVGDCAVRVASDPDMQTTFYTGTLLFGSATRHVLVSGLTPNTIYYYDAKCSNASGFDVYGWNRATTAPVVVSVEGNLRLEGITLQ